VAVGDVRLGGEQPIRVQSMTTPPPEDVAGTVAQIVRLAAAGCEIVRLTVPTTADADHLPEIRAALRRRGVTVPLVADIHFSPAAALRAVEHVEKVRVNPGNFADSKRFARREYTDAEYAAELERLEEKLRPLVLRAKALGVAMRIGTNHGSLSDRILNRYGDTPLGMVESALEFVRICEAHRYPDLVLSMKSSNPQITLQTYRLLAVRMAEEGMDYPFHLGVTEAGDGREGRIKSAIGIGALLEEGIGDTVRVSLTEDPVAEIPVAQALAAPFNAVLTARQPDRNGGRGAALRGSAATSARRSADVPTLYSRRAAGVVSWGPVTAGGSEPVRAEVRLRTADLDASLSGLLSRERPAEVISILARRGTELLRARSAAATIGTRGSAAALAVDLEAQNGLRPADLGPSGLRAFQRLDLLLPADATAARAGAAAWARLARAGGVPLALEFQAAPGAAPAGPAAALAVLEALGVFDASAPVAALVVRPAGTPGVLPDARRTVQNLHETGLDCPVLLVETAPADPACELLFPAARIGSLLCDGVGDAVRIEGPQPPRQRLDLVYDILQGARVRLSRTEFISCPSCGRTLFDLETTTRRIKQKTAHLKDVKIAIMGCVVNGPGEMADADFGYVGGAPGRVNLYVGKECVLRHVTEESADAELINLIKQHGRWQEPPAAAGDAA
jgi:(E)-4-hydroxy-3-methylbut-2-enyl-diphosphate synthase